MKSFFLFSIFLLFTTCLTSAQSIIKINLNEKGRTFEGIGALSAGGSSRLLINYPEPIRSQILDFLFKPKFGASLQHLKVEIGGDVNSTCGTEPSHARTREEYENPKPEYYHRGYEWWLMNEARKRNPDIYLDCLEWGVPGWIGNGKFYSQDNINYIIAFIKGARQYYNLKINYTGIWNERMYNIEFIKNLRKELDEKGLKDVGIVAADQCCDNQKWLIAEDMKNDKELHNAVSVIGDHYPERDTGNQRYNTNVIAKSFGIPLWNSEGGPWKGNWEGFSYLAKMFNRDYIEGAMTKNITWSLITSYFNNLSLPNSGLMTADTPWSGYFEVEPAVWAVAHTTQFTEPGWKYVNSGCGYLRKEGSYVTLASSSTNKDISIIVETMDANIPQTVTFKLNGNAKFKKIYIWRSIYGGATFEQLAPINAKKNEFTVIIQPKALYTFTTTQGQQKGTANPLPKAAFPFPYKANFEDEQLGTTPKYFSDQGGAFEVVKRSDQKGHCLQQMITRRAIEWERNVDVYNQTILGDTLWTDYSVSSDIFFPSPYSHATILARATEMHRSNKLPEAYMLKLKSSGIWDLMAGSKLLARGMVLLNKDQWQHLILETKGNTIKASINGKEVIKLTNSTYSHGIAGLGSSFHQVQFDNFSISSPKLE